VGISSSPHTAGVALASESIYSGDMVESRGGIGSLRNAVTTGATEVIPRNPEPHADSAGRAGRGRRDLFARKPYDEIYINEIAELPCRAACFLHFKDKRGLYLRPTASIGRDPRAAPATRSTSTPANSGCAELVRRHINYRREHVHTMLA